MQKNIFQENNEKLKALKRINLNDVETWKTKKKSDKGLAQKAKEP